MMEAGLSLPCTVHVRPVPDSFQKLTHSLGTSDLCISLKDRHVLCFVSKASGQTRGPDPGFPATDASLLQGTETRAGNTLGFNLSTQTLLGGWCRDHEFRVEVRKQLRALFAFRPPKDGEKQALAVLSSWGPRPTSRLCCSGSIAGHRRTQQALPCWPCRTQSTSAQGGASWACVGSLTCASAKVKRAPVRCPQVAEHECGRNAFRVRSHFRLYLD